MSLGPVMWVLFSELFSNRMRGIAISFVGLINSAVSFGVQLIFPWQLQNLGNSKTFLIYAAFALVGLPLVMKLLPETKGKSLEVLEAELAVKIAERRMSAVTHRLPAVRAADPVRGQCVCR